MISMENKIKLTVDTAELDDATEKANQLINLLKEAKQLIDSLSSRSKNSMK
jgi:hypothetical protein